MTFLWPGTSIVYGESELSDVQREHVKGTINGFSEKLESMLAAEGLPLHASPLWRPLNLFIIWDPERIWCAFSPATGMSEIRWTLQQHVFSGVEISSSLRQQFGWKVSALIDLPLPGAGLLDQQLISTATRHIGEIKAARRRQLIGSREDLKHLEPYWDAFLADHPDPENNFFVMMRFAPTKQLLEAHTAIKDTLASRGLKALRADDRNYTGDVWTNIELYMMGSRRGIAVFEDIEDRNFNPNVSLELGYMLGRQKQCMILKEKRLPNVPSDVVHRLYSSWDAFNTHATVSSAVARWVDIDLGMGQ